MENNKITPAVPAEGAKPEVTHITQEQLDELKKQGIELTPEELTKLESLMSSGVKVEKMDDGELNVAGGAGIALSPKMKKAMYALGAAAAAAAVGFGGYEAYKHRDKITGMFKGKKDSSATNIEQNGEDPKMAPPAGPAADTQ